MLIQDLHGKYEINIDINRCIVYEKNMGLWSSIDLWRFHNEFLTKVFPLLKGREWLKCTDLRDYEFSKISEEINHHVAICVENGLFGGIIIVRNEAVEIQMNNSVVYSGMIFSPISFTDIKSAEEWLNSHWI